MTRTKIAIGLGLTNATTQTNRPPAKNERGVYGEDYGVSYEGGMGFNHNARQVVLEDFGFEAGDRFTYTYNFIDHWLCDIRIEHIENSAKPTPWCYGGSGLQREDGARYYKIDEQLALFDILAKVITAKKSAKIGTLRPLIKHYENARFTRVLVNKQLVEAFHS